MRHCQKAGRNFFEISKTFNKRKYAKNVIILFEAKLVTNFYFDIIISKGITSLQTLLLKVNEANIQIIGPGREYAKVAFLY